MSVKLDGSMDEGDIRERLTLISNDAQFPTTEMAIAGRIRPSVSVSPAAVSLGTTTPTSVISRRLVVRGDEPFEIMDVQCADQRFQFKVPTGLKKVHLMSVEFKGDGNAARISQQIRIVTSLPGEKISFLCRHWDRVWRLELVNGTAVISMHWNALVNPQVFITSSVRSLASDTLHSIDASLAAFQHRRLRAMRGSGVASSDSEQA